LARGLANNTSRTARRSKAGKWNSYEINVAAQKITIAVSTDRKGRDHAIAARVFRYPTARVGPADLSDRPHRSSDEPDGSIGDRIRGL
jgi:hypothetical protein